MQWDKSFFENLYEAKKCNGYKIIAKGKKTYMDDKTFR